DQPFDQRVLVGDLEEDPRGDPEEILFCVGHWNGLPSCLFAYLVRPTRGCVGSVVLLARVLRYGLGMRARKWGRVSPARQLPYHRADWVRDIVVSARSALQAQIATIYAAGSSRLVPRAAPSRGGLSGAGAGTPSEA